MCRFQASSGKATPSTLRPTLCGAKTQIRCVPPAICSTIASTEVEYLAAYSNCGIQVLETLVGRTSNFVYSPKVMHDKSEIRFWKHVSESCWHHRCLLLPIGVQDGIMAAAEAFNDGMGDPWISRSVFFVCLKVSHLYPRHTNKGTATHNVALNVAADWLFLKRHCACEWPTRMAKPISIMLFFKSPNQECHRPAIYLAS